MGLACETKPTVYRYKLKQMQLSLNKHKLMVQKSLSNRNKLYIADMRMVCVGKIACETMDFTIMVQYRQKGGLQNKGLAVFQK